MMGCEDGGRCVPPVRHSPNGDSSAENVSEGTACHEVAGYVVHVVSVKVKGDYTTHRDDP